MINNIFLSICIPTYNRATKVTNLLKKILEYNENDIEVIVLDNCSNDNTEFLINQIIDDRLIYIKNQTNIGGVPNVLSSLKYANGKYAFLCLDKDKIDPNNIYLFINRLKGKEEIVFGQCLLNYFGIEFEDIIYEKGLNSLEKIAFTCEHPSGLFFKNDILKKENIIQKLLNENKDFAFNPDLLKAELSYFGKSIIINIPFVYTETLEECASEISHTYKGKNIYFMPKSIIKRYNIFLKKLNQLNISKEDKIIISRKLYFSNLNYSVQMYKDIMKNKSICLHHGIMPKEVSRFETIKIIIFFNINYLLKKNDENFYSKIKNVFTNQIAFLFKIIKK